MAETPKRQAAISPSRLFFGEALDSSEGSDLEDDSTSCQSDSEQNSVDEERNSTPDKETQQLDHTKEADSSSEYISRSGETWFRTPPPTGRARNINIINTRIGPNPQVKNKVITVADSFGLFFYERNA